LNCKPPQKAVEVFYLRLERDFKEVFCQDIKLNIVLTPECNDGYEPLD